MPLKAAARTTPGSSGSPGDTSIGDPSVDLQIVTIRQLRDIVDQINIGQEAFKNKLNSIGTKKVKLLAVERFNGTRVKLKGYLTQILFKLQYKGHRIITLVDIVAYAGIFLSGRALKQFKFYLTEYQTNTATTSNLKIRYIFLS